VRAKSVLEHKKDALEAITRRLLEVETLERAELEALATISLS
jgi:ATP-dependent Zn protease